MLPIFCLRLAFGLVACLLVLTPSVVPPRFFRVQYLTALGLLSVAWLFLRGLADPVFFGALGVSMVTCIVGSIVWHVEGHPGSRLVLALAGTLLLTVLVLGGQALRGGKLDACLVVDDVASAAVLGTATSAMLMGHSYLIAPAMSLSPLYRLLWALGLALVGRIVLACLGLYLWTVRPEAGNLETEVVLWLGVRWVIGLAGPLVLGWLAWETARIRSTQSATGILYVVVILGFLGELTSQLLLEKTGAIL
jgi:hypothetical protein